MSILSFEATDLSTFEFFFVCMGHGPTCQGHRSRVGSPFEMRSSIDDSFYSIANYRITCQAKTRHLIHSRYRSLLHSSVSEAETQLGDSQKTGGVKKYERRRAAAAADAETISSTR